MVSQLFNQCLCFATIQVVHARQDKSSYQKVPFLGQPRFDQRYAHVTLAGSSTNEYFRTVCIGIAVDAHADIMLTVLLRILRNRGFVQR